MTLAQDSISQGSDKTSQGLIRAALGAFFFFATYGIIAGALPAELASREFGPSYIGLVVGFHALGAVFFRILAPNAIDQHGARKVAAIAALVGAASSLLLGMAMIVFDAALLVLAFANFVHGVASIAFMISGYAYVAQAGDPKKSGTRIGTYGSIASLGLLVPPPIGIWMWSQGENFYLWLLPFAFGLPAMFLLPGDQRKREAAESGDDVEGSLTLLFGAVVLAPAFGLAVTAGMQGGFEAQMPFLVTEFSAQAIIVHLYALFGVSVALGRLGGGWLVDRSGAKMVFFAGLACQTFSLAIPLLVQTSSGLLSSSIVFGVGSGMVGTAAIALLVSVVSPQRSGAAIGLGAMLRDAGFAAGAGVTGLIIAIGGAKAFLLSGVAMTLAAIAVAAYIFRSKSAHRSVE